MLFPKKSARRLAVAADVAEAQSKTGPRSRPHMGQALLIAGVFFVLATAILYYPFDRVRYRLGDRPTSDLVSPVDFTVADADQMASLREARKAISPPVLVLDNEVLDRVVSQMYNLPADVGEVGTVEGLPEKVRQRWPGLTNEALAALRRMDVKAFQQEVANFAKRPSNLPLVDAATAEAVSKKKEAEDVLLANGALESTLGRLPKVDVVPLNSTDPAKRAYLREHAQVFPQPLIEPIVSYLLHLDRPLFRYDAKLSEAYAARAAAEVKPQGEFVRKGTVLVKKGDPIDKRAHDRLEMAQDQYELELARQHPWARVLWRLGQALIVLILTVAGTLYVTQMNAQLNTVGRGWALVGLLLITLFIAKGSVGTGLFHLVYLLGIAPTLLTTIILVIAFNQRFALGIASMHGLLVTLALGQDVSFYLTILAGVAVFTFGLSEIRNRGKLIEMGVFASGALLITVWALGMARYMGSIWNGGELPTIDNLRIAQNSLWAAAAGVTVGFVTLGILPFIESIFKITTAMTLLELCDLNQPLLRRLAAEAPGTFNHSLVVGTLAEAAGNAIGANGLLCRVGAYYHDIGKLSKPQYFIENQSGGPNRHDKLSPAMSLLIIVGHVKDGIELAREYALPWVVHQFIGQHHGTTLVEYFYHAAREKQARELEARGDDVPAVSEAEFRYPGPKPQTRETAILMISDGCESIVRSMAEPTAGRIETAVHQLIMKRLMDGQFSDSDLTLRELGEIEQALVRTLAGVYHGRVAYPKPLPMSQPA